MVNLFFKAGYSILFFTKYIYHLDLLHFHFYEISLPTDVVASSIKTPSALEDKITKKYGLLPGNFIFYEWGKIKEDILITSERTALINKHTSK